VKWTLVKSARVFAILGLKIIEIMIVVTVIIALATEISPMILMYSANREALLTQAAQAIKALISKKRDAVANRKRTQARQERDGAAKGDAVSGISGICLEETKQVLQSNATTLAPSIGEKPNLELKQHSHVDNFTRSSSKSRGSCKSSGSSGREKCGDTNNNHSNYVGDAENDEDDDTGNAKDDGKDAMNSPKDNYKTTGFSAAPSNRTSHERSRSRIPLQGEEKARRGSFATMEAAFGNRTGSEKEEAEALVQETAYAVWKEVLPDLGNFSVETPRIDEHFYKKKEEGDDILVKAIQMRSKLEDLKSKGGQSNETTAMSLRLRTLLRMSRKDYDEAIESVVPDITKKSKEGSCYSNRCLVHLYLRNYKKLCFLSPSPSPISVLLTESPWNPPLAGVSWTAQPLCAFTMKRWGGCQKMKAYRKVQQTWKWKKAVTIRSKQIKRGCSASCTGVILSGHYG